MSKKVSQYLIGGIVLFYIALSDDQFELFCNGIALIAGFVSVSFAIIELRKKPE